MEKIIIFLESYFENLSIKTEESQEKIVLTIEGEKINSVYQIICHKPIVDNIFSLIVAEVGIIIYENYENQEQFLDDLINFFKRDVLIITRKLESRIIDKVCIYNFDYKDNIISPISFKRYYNSIWFWQKSKVLEETKTYFGYSKK